MNNSHEVLTQLLQNLAAEVEAFSRQILEKISAFEAEIKQELAEIRSEIEATKKEGSSDASESH